MICFSQNHNWRHRGREMFYCRGGTLQLSNSPATVLETVQILLPLSISPCSPCTLSAVICDVYDVICTQDRKGELNPKGLTLESLFLSAPELLREKRRVRLRLLAEFLLRLELFNCAGRSGTVTSIKYLTANNGATGIQYQTNISTLMKYSVWPSSLIVSDFILNIWFSFERCCSIFPETESMSFNY